MDGDALMALGKDYSKHMDRVESNGGVTIGVHGVGLKEALIALSDINGDAVGEVNT